MKKIVLSLMLLVSASNLFSQAVSTGNFIFDAYYGAPNLGKSFFNSIEDEEETQNFTATGIGPAGLRGEYMIGETFGLGFDVIYNSNNIKYTQIDSLNPSNTYNYERTMNRLRVQLRFNFHFNMTNPNLDTYFGIAAGSNSRFRKFYIDGVETKDDNFLGSGVLIPVSLRVCGGMRYYFNQNIGLNAEIGLGGPLISAGLSVKF
ncbi:MAG: outer membrane beta-barrel protein [Fluviicola sp.]|nr:outer membrane beta-barrel protein [Fluviicola sp.]